MILRFTAHTRLRDGSYVDAGDVRKLPEDEGSDLVERGHAVLVARRSNTADAPLPDFDSTVVTAAMVPWAETRS